MIPGLSEQHAAAVTERAARSGSTQQQQLQLSTTLAAGLTVQLSITLQLSTTLAAGLTVQLSITLQLFCYLDLHTFNSNTLNSRGL